LLALPSRKDAPAAGEIPLIFTIASSFQFDTDSSSVLGIG
jgi:hypothetical protein